jgi:predicted phosphoadenosine phosphosulfate sulfurtransferase
MIPVDSTPLAPSSVQPLHATSRLVEMWLHGLSPPTQDRYRRTARRFLAFVNKPLHLVTLADIQGWQLTLKELSPSSQRTAIATIKSLLSFGHKIGGNLSITAGKADEGVEENKVFQGRREGVARKDKNVV